MRRFATFVVLLLLLSAAAPMLACATDRGMTPTESACCHAMHGNCGDMAKMGCCVKKIATDDHPQMVATAPSIPLRWIVLTLVAPFSWAEVHAIAVARTPVQHPPPGLLVVQTTNLRI